eukprot:2337689-Rhodomonas_salina.1
MPVTRHGDGVASVPTQAKTGAPRHFSLRTVTAEAIQSQCSVPASLLSASQSPASGLTLTVNDSDTDTVGVSGIGVEVRFL